MDAYKTCPACGESKPVGEFNRSSAAGDGRQWMCRLCHSRYNRARYREDPDAHREASRRYREGNPERVLETRLGMCERNPSKKNANMALEQAVAMGAVERPDMCMGCGRPSSEAALSAHHPDYRRPLDVVWLCPACHKGLDASRRLREGKSRYGTEKPVVMLHAGEEVCRFEKVSDAARAVGVTPSAISACLSGRSATSAGCEWRYGEAVSDG